ncbi:MAG: dihydrodipicolinate synthase family protein [Planctomycetales bacterium]|nr:dihydrodipicolinate synthase family protein [Planctomycetales bacterium]
MSLLPHVRPGRRITGMSAILLPFTANGLIDWDGFAAHVARTAEAGLVPAVNMDTGFVNLLTPPERLDVLRRTRDTLANQPATNGRDRFVAGSFVTDQPGDRFQLDAYRREIDLIREHGGTPVIFQSFGLTGQDATAIVASYAAIAKHCPQFIGFELGQMFAPFGRVYDLDTYAELLDITECVGAKHSSLKRSQEWDRLQLRDERRPDFHVFTGNDLAIDMVMYGSDYLLGLSTMAPDLFARRDAMWAAADPAFFELNDLLQYLGQFTFRDPVPAYKHSAAQFLKLRGWISSDQPHPRAIHRPDSDVTVLADILRRLEQLA